VSNAFLSTLFRFAFAIVVGMSWKFGHQDYAIALIALRIGQAEGSIMERLFVMCQMLNNLKQEWKSL